MSENIYTEKKISLQYKDYLFEQFHPKINHSLSKFIIKKNDDIILIFYGKSSLPSAISQSYYFVYLYHFFFERKNNQNITEDWMYFNLYGHEVMLINLSTAKIYDQPNKWFGKVNVNPNGTILARIGHPYSSDTSTLFYEIVELQDKKISLVYLPYDETIKEYELNNSCGYSKEIYKWVDDDTIEYTEDEFFSKLTKKFYPEMDDNEFDDNDIYADDKYYDLKFYRRFILKKINNKMSIIEKVFSPDSLIYKSAQVNNS
jgi:hypothetical protein